MRVGRMLAGLMQSSINWAHFRPLDSLQYERSDALTDTPPYLRRVVALLERILLRHHLQHAHAERVHVDRLVVVLLVQLGRDELRRTQHTLNHCSVTGAGQTEVTQPHLTRAAVHEYVIALEVAVDDGRRQVVEIVQRMQQLTTPNRARHAHNNKPSTTMSHKLALHHCAVPFVCAAVYWTSTSWERVCVVHVWLWVGVRLSW